MNGTAKKHCSLCAIVLIMLAMLATAAGLVITAVPLDLPVVPRFCGAMLAVLCIVTLISFATNFYCNTKQNTTVGPAEINSSHTQVGRIVCR